MDLDPCVSAAEMGRRVRLDAQLRTTDRHITRVLEIIRSEGCEGFERVKPLFEEMVGFLDVDHVRPWESWDNTSSGLCFMEIGARYPDVAVALPYDLSVTRTPEVYSKPLFKERGERDDGVVRMHDQIGLKGDVIRTVSQRSVYVPPELGGAAIVAANWVLKKLGKLPIRASQPQNRLDEWTYGFKGNLYGLGGHEPAELCELMKADIPAVQEAVNSFRSYIRQKRVSRYG